MNFAPWQNSIQNFDSRRNIALPGSYDQTLEFCVEFFIEQARLAILEKDFFTVALSGGSTPKAIFKKLASKPYANRVEWNKILFFFGDERSVPPDDANSNYKMAMECALTPLDIPSEHIFRMVAEKDPVDNAQAYSKLIDEKVPNAQFDLIMLGMGDDGHTASLFPQTRALDENGTWVTYNEVPQKNTHRMTLTYPCINQAHHICFFVLGAPKASVVKKVLQGPYEPHTYPSQKVGTTNHPALWILDHDAATELDVS